MRIGIAAPVTLSLLASHLYGQPELGDGYAFAPMAPWILGLRNRGHEVTVFTLSPDTTSMKTYQGDHLTVHVAPYRKTGRAKDGFRHEIAGLRAFMQTYPQDVIHAHWTYEFALAAQATGQPTVVTAHDSPQDVLRLNLSPYRLVRMGMAAKVLARAGVVSAVSPYMAAKIKAFTLGKVVPTVVPNGIPDEVFQHQARRLHLGEQTTFASVQMGFTGRKNGPTLLHAFAQVRQSLPGARLLLFGAGYEPDGEAQKYAAAAQIIDGIEFCGQLAYDELLRRLSNEADILVHPSLEESFGMAVAEAMALGLPVIVGQNSGALPWLVGEGEAGVLTDVTHPNTLATAMLGLAQDSAKQDKLAEMGRKFVQARYTLQAQLEGYEQLYLEAITRAKAGQVAH